MKYFLSFCGYPRSGHTLVAAILNANPNCMISNQLNIFNNDKVNMNYIRSYSLITGTWKPTTQVPHVPKQEITVVGDKTGHRTVEILNSTPQRLGMIKSQIGVPLKWIHVVRNPFDNLTTWAKLNYENNKQRSQSQHLNNVIEKYIKLNETIARLKRSEDVLTVRHEYVITRMHNTLEEMANFLEISFDPIWRDNVRNTVWKKPRITRRQIPWTQKQKGIVHDIINQYDWFKGYDFGGCGRC
jgi:hypothetical protein